MNPTTIYLGDGLYYQMFRDTVRLYASDGVSVSNEIYIERELISPLLKQLALSFGANALIKILEETKQCD
jgi:hypothetical protein